MAEYYDEAQLSQSKAKTDLKRSLEIDGTECIKKKKLEDGTEVYDLELKYNRYRYIIKTVHLIFPPYSVMGHFTQDYKLENLLKCTSSTNIQQYTCKMSFK